jgi:REP-associated tyrosine transposase
MVLASHIIFTAYGFWLPNDPRGSWSDFVRSWELMFFGKATKTDERRSVADVEHDWELRRAARKGLKFPPAKFTGEQALAIPKDSQKRSENQDTPSLRARSFPITCTWLFCGTNVPRSESLRI